MQRGQNAPKKTADCEAIFANVRTLDAAANADPWNLRLSMDTKASVVLGSYSREGKSRGLEAVRALDHDLATKKKLVPMGILEVQSGQLELALGSSARTSDLLVDTLEGRWQRRGPALTHVRGLVINADNGPESNGKRTQFLSRMVAFADASGLRIRWPTTRPTTASTSPSNVAGSCWSATGTVPCSPR